MRTSTYTTSDGTSFDVSGRSGIALASKGPFGWEYSSSDGAPSRSERKISAELGFATRADREQASRLMELCALDMDNATPGTWEVDGWSLDCYLLTADAASYATSNRKLSVSILAPDPVWRRETHYEFMPASGSGSDIGGYDYEHDYPHDYGALAQSASLDVAAIAPCDFRLTVYGYATKPSIYLAGNRYGVDVTVPSGGLLVIDSTKKRSMKGDSVVLYDKFGNAQDVFSKRVRGAEGSGSYIYERISHGSHEVTWDQGWGFSLDLIERRAALPWT